MSVLNTLPAPVIQMGLVEKIVEVQQNQPHVQQLVAQATAREALREDQSRVAAAVISEESRRIRDDADDRKQQEQRRSDRQDRGGRQPEDAPEAEAPGGKPWTGHILDITI